MVVNALNHATLCFNVKISASCSIKFGLPPDEKIMGKLNFFTLLPTAKRIVLAAAASFNGFVTWFRIFSI